jgi:esterase/lipase
MEIIKFIEVNKRKIASVINDAGNKNIVIFCHGFRSSKIGPNRFFVKVARELEKQNISSLRFDQYGSGDSEGDFIDSRFDDWVKTTEEIINDYLSRGYKVSLLGQSMGGSSVLVVASHLGNKLQSVVVWVPDPSVDKLKIYGKHMDEGGQRVDWDFWKQAHQANIVDCFKKIKAPTYVVFCDNDEYVSAENQQALISVAQPHQKIKILKGHTHSSWAYDQASKVIQNTIQFLVFNFH